MRREQAVRKLEDKLHTEIDTWAQYKQQQQQLEDVS
jgi:hypothetical protein